MKHYHHLNQAQKEALKAAINRYTERPTYKQYTIEGNLIKIISISPKPKRKEITNSIKGFESNEIKLLNGFNASVDMPSGWGIHSMYDSGGNFKIVNAGSDLWTHIWNYWNSPITKQIIKDLLD